MTITLRKSQLAFSLALSMLAAGSASGADAPTPKAALGLQPVQRDVEIERPEAAEIEKCAIKAEPKKGWVVRDGGGQILRTFTDTNGDGVVDQWCYYKDGVEVYRDIDSNFNRKADQCRWMNTGGSRWGIDRNEDGKIDAWKTISPEEVTAELVAAMRDRDRERFERLLLSASELKTLGTGPAKTEQLKKKTEIAAAGFAKMAAGQQVVTPQSKWVSFGGMQPGLVPIGTDDATSDLNVYENVMAMVETEGKPPAPLSVGTLVRVGDTWRLIDLPTMGEGGTEPFFFPMPRPQQADGAPVAGQPSERMQAIMKDLQALPDLASSTPQDHAKRVELLKQLAEEDPENRAQWYTQIADSLSAAVQTGGYEEGITKLRELADELAKDPKDEDLAFHVEWRWMTAQHGHDLAQPKTDFPSVQAKWIGDLTAFVDKAKKHPTSADALMELAISQEFGGDEAKALEAYTAVVQGFPGSPLMAKAAGAKTRLESPGKPIALKGKTLSNAPFDLAANKNKVTLIQYWATWSDLSKADMPLLKELRTKYGKEFEVVGVCLDNDPQAMMAYLKQNDPRWPQLFEEGGIEASRYATEMGIQIVPTMILVDKTGKVANRNIRADELETELQKLLK
jgi:thiol-disulfide isomerase/thioredoxin